VVNISDDEFLILQDTDFLLQKQKISKSIVSTLSETEQALKSSLDNHSFDFPLGTKVQGGKISKGENYRELPFFILDYPRLFTRQSIFAFRVMVWWGHEISLTIHLSGTALDTYQDLLKQNISLLTAPHYLCVGNSPWEYHFETDNYQSITQLDSDARNKALSKGFVKISRKYELSYINQLPSLAPNILSNYLRLLS
jgi:hypothetical protein